MRKGRDPRQNLGEYPVLKTLQPYRSATGAEHRRIATAKYRDFRRGLKDWASQYLRDRRRDRREQLHRKVAFLPVTTEIDETLCTVHLDGAVDLTSAPALKDILVQALQSGKDLQVELTDTAELDITALQLLWAAAREAKGSGTRCELHGEVPEKLLTTVENAGFASFPIDRM